MTLFEALPDDITEALYHYCKDDECLNDATLRALRAELKLDKAEHNKYSHDCFRCDKFKEYKNELQKNIIRSESIIKRLLVNRPDTYSGTDVMTNQTKMFAFANAVNDAIEYLKEVGK